MKVDDVVRLIRDIAGDAGRVIPAGTHGTIRQEVATGVVVEFCLCEPAAVVSALVSAEDLEFLWRDPDNPLIHPGATLLPWLSCFRRRIAAHKAK